MSMRIFMPLEVEVQPLRRAKPRRSGLGEYLLVLGTGRLSESLLGCGQGQLTLDPEVRTDAGDSTVPIWSATLPGVASALVGSPHSTIYKDNFLRTTLGSVLGRFGILGEEKPAFTLQTVDEVIPAGEDFVLTIIPKEPIARFDGKITFVELDEDGKRGVRSKAVVLKYGGTPLDRISIVVKAPEVGGAYELELSGAKDQVAASLF